LGASPALASAVDHDTRPSFRQGKLHRHSALDGGRDRACAYCYRGPGGLAPLEDTLMKPARRHRTPLEVAAIMDRLQYLADHPGLVERMQGGRALDGLGHYPRDTRRSSDGSSHRRYIADYSSPTRDQEANYASGLL